MLFASQLDRGNIVQALTDNMLSNFFLKLPPDIKALRMHQANKVQRTYA